MSHSTAIPIDTDQSDSRILIDACLARVRQDAGLDAEPVLPPLDVLLGKPETRPATRIVVGPSAQQLPSAEAIVKSSARPASVTTAKVERHDAKRSISRRMRWPVLLCGFIGGLFGGAAVMKSPIGHKPAVQHVVKTVQHHVEGAVVATAALKSRFVKR